MRTRRRFSAEFKAKVALEAIRGHETVAELAASTNCTRPGLLRGSARRRAEVFDEKGSAREQNRDAELTKLHAKIGQLVVGAIFCRKPSIVIRFDHRLPPIHAQRDRRQFALAHNREPWISRSSFYREPRRRTVPRDALVRLAADGAASAPQRLVRWAPSRPSSDAHQLCLHRHLEGYICCGI
jgi:transposase